MDARQILFEPIKNSIRGHFRESPGRMARTTKGRGANFKGAKKDPKTC